MANPEHIQAVVNGKEHFLQWIRKKEDYFVELDLEGADLHDQDLSGLFLSKANLRKADLSNAILENTSLNAADLEGANLKGATLRKANLNLANLKHCNLEAADLTNTFLVGANLVGANLLGTIIEDANLNRTEVDSSIEQVVLKNCDIEYEGFRQPGVFSKIMVPSFNILRTVYNQPKIDSIRIMKIMLKYGFDVFSLGLPFSGSWPTIRKIGNLSILTRASYFALVLIPILAWLWQPVVHRVVNDYNTVVNSTVGVVDLNTAQLDSIEASIPKEKFTEEIKQYIKRVKEANVAMSIQLTDRLKEPADMPKSLMFLFFSALFVVLGHLLYEIFADDKIKSHSRDSYMKESFQHYEEKSASSTFLLSEALSQLSEHAKEQPNTYHPNLVRLTGRLVYIPNDMNVLAGMPTRRGASVLSAAAGRDYDDAASKNTPVALICAIFYLLAACMIFIIIGWQSKMILTASGIDLPEISSLLEFL